MRFCALSSGSSGNSFFIEEGKSAILVDAGLSAKQLNERMIQKNLDSKKLKGIFITHEHSDHIKGADVLARQLQIPIFATEKTISNSSLMFSNAEIKEIDNDESLKVDSLNIKAFPKSHSAADPVSFLINGKSKKNVGVITDLGYASKHVNEAISESNFLFLESNHDVKMLEEGPYLPWHKKWVLSNTGHLSNLQASLSVLEFANKDLKGVVLSHLSKINNTPQLALKSFNNIIKERYDLHPLIDVSIREEPTQIFSL